MARGESSLAKTLKEIRQFMDRMGIPGRDLWDLPSSSKTFPDGAHWRIEISGVEYPSSLEAMIDEARKRDVSVHRVIATVGGATQCDFGELKAMAKMARDEKFEVVTTIGPRKGWDVGARELANREGSMNGFRLRGSDNISYWIADMMRCLEAGLRGFLVYDEGVLSIVTKMRAEGFIPKETVFKFSVFGGYCSAAGARVIESMGATTMNPSSDVSLPILAAIRKTVDMPLDVYISVVDSFGGMYRAYEAGEIARVAAPCYFKFEPGTAEDEIYKPWVTEEWHQYLVRQKVKMAQVVTEIVSRQAPELKLSAKGPADLILPTP
jgi:hypothetical protein